MGDWGEKMGGWMKKAGDLFGGLENWVYICGSKVKGLYSERMPGASGERQRKDKNIARTLIQVVSSLFLGHRFSPVVIKSIWLPKASCRRRAY